MPSGVEVRDGHHAVRVADDGHQFGKGALAGRVQNHVDTARSQCSKAIGQTRPVGDRYDAEPFEETPATCWTTPTTPPGSPLAPTGNLVLDLGSDKTFNTVNLKENIKVGQRTSGFAVDIWDGQSWREVGKAGTIGYRRILKLSESVTTSKVRLRITSSRALSPAIATVSLHNDQ